ncbi:MAG TPA: YdeI/OmpD-associated family protein [Polyangiaceae bacterium]|nr:YdeI/OmpD-associated family protein [Polyangiaceae bacterium]
MARARPADAPPTPRHARPADAAPAPRRARPADAPPAPRRAARPRDAFEHEFVATVEAMRLGRAQYLVVYLPASLRALPAFAGRARRRMKGIAAGHPLQRAWQPAGDGRRYVMLGATFCRRAGLAPGDAVTLRFSLVDDGEVDVPAELAEVLRQEPGWRKLWRALTPGKQRGVAYYVDSARGPETRARRAVDVMRRLEAGEPLGPKRR